MKVVLSAVITHFVADMKVVLSAVITHFVADMKVVLSAVITHFVADMKVVFSTTRVTRDKYRRCVRPFSLTVTQETRI